VVREHVDDLLAVELVRPEQGPASVSSAHHGVARIVLDGVADSLDVSVRDVLPRLALDVVVVEARHHLVALQRGGRVARGEETERGEREGGDRAHGAARSISIGARCDLVLFSWDRPTFVRWIFVIFSVGTPLR
jgi:hypothetical protein